MQPGDSKCQAFPVNLESWPLNMVWHKRFQTDSAQRRLREQLVAAAGLAKDELLALKGDAHHLP